jgi:hypothetical protein
MELDGQGNLLSEEHDSGPTKLLSKEHDDWDTYLDRALSFLGDKPWNFAFFPSMELDGQGNLLSEEHDSGPTKLLDDLAKDLDRYFSMSDK